MSGPVAMQSGMHAESPQVLGRPGNRRTAPMYRTRQVGDVRSVVFHFASNLAIAGSYFTEDEVREREQEWRIC